jgi:hypothetical protein
MTNKILICLWTQLARNFCPLLYKYSNNLLVQFGMKLERDVRTGNKSIGEGTKNKTIEQREEREEISATYSSVHTKG